MRVHYKNNIMRTKAHQIYHDPEALREDIFEYKKKLEDKLRENNCLKKKYDKLELENTHYENFIQNNEYFWNTNENNQSKLLVSLKKQEKKLQQTLKNKQAEYEEANRSVKNTKIKEMDIEIEELEEECKRLSSILIEIMQNPESNEAKLSEMEQKYLKKRNLINFLKKDNEEMNLNLRILVDQNSNYKSELDAFDTEIGQFEETLSQLKNEIKIKDAQIKLLQREDQNPQLGEAERKIKEELEYPLILSSKVREDKKTLEQEIESKEDQIHKIEDEIRNAKRGYEQQLESDKQEKLRLKKELDEIKRKMDMGVQHLSEENLSDEEASSRENIENPVRAEVTEAHEESTNFKEETVAKDKQTQRVANQIKPDDIEEVLIDEAQIDPNEITFEYINFRLESEPFKMYSEEKRDIVIKSLSQSLGSKKSFKKGPIVAAFSKLVGQYSLLSREVAENLHFAITKKINQKQDKLKETFATQIENDEDSPACTMEEIKKVFLSVELDLTDKQTEFVLLKLFEQSEDLDYLPFPLIFRIFSDSAQMKEDQQHLHYESPNKGDNFGQELSDGAEDDLLNEY